ncbi:MAG: DsbA family protein, partial [Paracoccus sp. (in: a-proteobacteria)]|nr:DsbA family protein [Paracoccus sp. (in: a-proteobacteria)]
MLTRRFILASAGATAALGALPATAADRENPMPEDLRRSLERDPTAPVLGNGDGNITLTEFFDYN